MILIIIAAVLILPIVLVLLISVIRHRKYPEKRFTHSVLNTILGPVRFFKLGPYVQGTLTLEKGMKFGMKSSKLNDFGDMEFVKTYDAICNLPTQKSLKLTNVGYLMYRNELNYTMSRRLKAIQYYKSNPDVLKIPLRSPVFVLGLPRTGTTFLHRLLSLDPAVRSPLLWELMNPVPSVSGPSDTLKQEVFDADMSKRAKFARKLLKVRESLGDDSLKHIHEIDADLPEECLIAMADDLPLHLSYFYSVFTNFKTSMTALNSERVTNAYKFYKKTLQMLNHQYIAQRANPPRWVLKCPMHLYFIPELAAAFPDAKIIWTHRHPASAVPSLCSLVKSIYQVYYEVEGMDEAKLGASIRDISAEYLIRAVDDINKSELGNTHVLYNNLVDDPIGTVKNIYAQYGWSFTKEYEEILNQYLEKDKIKREEAKASKRQSNSSVLHHYTPEEFSLTTEELSSGNFAKYVEMFKVPMSKN